MRAAVFAFSRQGCRTAERIAGCLNNYNAELYAPERLAEGDFGQIPHPSADFYGELFTGCDALVFVGACGIAVRAAAPHVKSKLTDPAVLSVDELGKFVIALLSGHIGGANRLAKFIADKLGALPVISTATDINGKFSPDSWAAEHGCAIADMAAAKAVSAAILEGDVPLYTELPVKGAYPPGTFPGKEGDRGIYIGWEKKSPFKTTVRLIPGSLHLGLGCRRGTTCEAIKNAVDKVFEENNIDFRAVKTAASIDIKSGEEGLQKFASEAGLAIEFFSAEELMSLEGKFSASPFVERVTGADNICERAAMISADRLIVKKTAIGGVTVAVAAEDTEVDFG
ncbi:MAG: cobalt-precorrin 5A hydrolase [Candidatus Limivicinus sp.]|jgi:cobalt-precorrin 5A hydrolase